MAGVPTNPKLYHITHVDNFASMVAEGAVVSDATMVGRGGPAAMIGMSKIKQRRLNALRLTCRTSDFVGAYVPFYFCPRSVMLYIIYQGNHPDIAYTGGQQPIVHLEYDLNEVVANAATPWAFTATNAGAFYTRHYDDLGDLGQIDWTAVAARDWQACKEKKQAEFLLRDRAPLGLVKRIGVHNSAIKDRIERDLQGSAFAPSVEVLPGWYY